MQRRGALIKCHGWRCWRCLSRIISVSFPLCFRLSQLIFSCDGDTYNSPLGPLAHSSCSTIGTPMLMRSWAVREAGNRTWNGTWQRSREREELVGLRLDWPLIASGAATMTMTIILRTPIPVSASILPVRKRRERKEECETVTTCFKYSSTPLGNCILYVCCQWMLKTDYTKFNWNLSKYNLCKDSKWILTC